MRLPARACIVAFAMCFFGCAHVRPWPLQAAWYLQSQVDPPPQPPAPPSLQIALLNRGRDEIKITGLSINGAPMVSIPLRLGSGRLVILGSQQFPGVALGIPNPPSENCFLPVTVIARTERDTAKALRRLNKRMVRAETQEVMVEVVGGLPSTLPDGAVCRFD